MKNLITILFVTHLGLCGCLATGQDSEQIKAPTGSSESTASDDSENNSDDSSNLQPINSPDEGEEDIAAEPIDFTTVGVPCEPGPPSVRR